MSIRQFVQIYSKHPIIIIIYHVGKKRTTNTIMLGVLTKDSVTWHTHTRVHRQSPFFEFVLLGQCEVPMMLCGRL